MSHILTTSTPAAGARAAIPAQTLNFFSDPGHGWLEAPTQLLRQLNITGLISCYSYLSQDGRTAYLEEDCDAPVLIKALKERGVPYQVKELPSASSESFIRRLRRFAA